MVDKADIAPDPEVSMDLLKGKEIIGRNMETNIDLDTEVSKSKGKGEENLEERGRKKEVPLFVSTDRGIATVLKELDSSQCTLVLPTRLQTRPPTTSFLSSRTVRRRRLRR